MKQLSLLFILTLALAAAPNPGRAESVSVPQNCQQITLSFASIVKQAAPAVVNIYTQKMVRQNVSPLLADPFFREFFGNALSGMPRQRLENSLGSGVIVSANGLIVTSNHVIAGADQIRVVLADRREMDATVVTTDDHADLAVLRVDAKGEKLPYIELKDSDEAEVGDLVLAIGDPFGVGQTVTSGIISAMAHGAVGSSDYDYFIQTDAAINPGNSGGALVTMDGKLVGINSAIYSRDGGNMGIGFAVPSNLVRVVLNAGTQGKKTITHPWLGFEGQEITPELAASLSMPEPMGLIVKHIYDSSPAVKAGLKIGDVIVSVNGKRVEDPDAFHYRIATLSIGSTATLGIIRKGEKMELSMPLIAPPENTPREKTVVTGRNPLAGATIENLSPAVSEETGLRGVERGVVVTEVRDNSIAASLGLQPGDIVLAVNGAKTPAVNDVLGAVQKHTGGWRVSIRRGDSTLTLMVGG